MCDCVSHYLKFGLSESLPAACWMLGAGKGDGKGKSGKGKEGKGKNGKEGNGKEGKGKKGKGPKKGGSLTVVCLSLLGARVNKVLEP